MLSIDSYIRLCLTTEWKRWLRLYFSSFFLSVICQRYCSVTAVGVGGTAQL